MTSMYVQGNNEGDPANGPFNPLCLTVDTYVIYVDQYKIDISLRVNILMQRLHFSIIIFDEQDV